MNDISLLLLSILIFTCMLQPFFPFCPRPFVATWCYHFYQRYYNNVARIKGRTRNKGTINKDQFEAPFIDLINGTHWKLPKRKLSTYETFLAEEYPLMLDM